MVKEVVESEIGPFLDLIGEVEVGEHYDRSRSDHVDWLKERVRRHYARGGEFLALYDEEETPLGIACLLVERQLYCDYSTGEVLSIGIFPQKRGRGYGSALLAFIEQEARRRGCYWLYLWTYAADCRNITFYGKNGFLPVAVLPDRNGPGDKGDMCMRKLLV
ncbi:MAG: hypothetical protein A2Z18_07300 [Armatimonadetes bacterium RBG_16_58_9]|nr:MAG: hypothetical protein A2Z18_07300 [Armatimonadetes bacterium RBG_16_58_9]